MVSEKDMIINLMILDPTLNSPRHPHYMPVTRGLALAQPVTFGS